MCQTVALAFAPLGFVRLAWQAVKVTASDLARADEFVAYFEETISNNGDHMCL